MSSAPRPKVGSIGWFDLTVEHADAVRDFYAAVVGWKWAAVDMKGYSDYCMNLPATGETTAGICHRRGVNAHLPSQWLMYINIENLDQSMARVVESGGKILVPPRGNVSQGRFCVIEDPAGAVVALFEPAKQIEPAKQSAE